MGYRTSVEDWDCRGCVRYLVGCRGYPDDIKRCLEEQKAREHEPFWLGHEFVRKHAKKGRYYLLEILRTQWNEDYFKDAPFVIRICDENYDEFKTLAEAQACLERLSEND